MVESRWENLRAGVEQLNLLEVNAIAGEVCDDLIATFRTGRFSPFYNLTTAGIIERYIEDRGQKNRDASLHFYEMEIDDHLARKGLLVDPPR